MRQIILSLLLIFSFGSSATGAELIERFANAEIYKTGPNTRQLVMGGDIENALPFDGGAYTSWNLVYAEGTPVGNWTWLGKGTIGYLIKPSLSIVRMYPVRGDQTKFIEIAPIAAQPSTVNQISAKSLELYVDQTNTRWSLSMTPQGFKPNILLKEGYSGDGTFQFRFELNGGLTLNGAWIMDGANHVLRMHNPFMVDAEGINRAVDESLVDGVVTLTADISGLTLPILVDPTLGPINPNMDTTLVQSAPTKGYGQSDFINLINKATSLNQRTIIQFDGSAIPAGSSITSATYEQYQYAGGGPDAQIYADRLTVYDWEDAGTVTTGAEANWNYYKDPNVAWPGGTGGGGDTDNTDRATATVGSSTNNSWVSLTVTGMMQDAIDNRSGLLNMFIRFTTEDVAVFTSTNSRSLEYGTAAQRPKLTVVWEVPRGGVSTHLGYQQMVF